MISWPELLMIGAINSLMLVALVRVARSTESGPQKVIWTALIVALPALGALAYLLRTRGSR